MFGRLGLFSLLVVSACGHANPSDTNGAGGNGAGGGMSHAGAPGAGGAITLAGSPGYGGEVSVGGSETGSGGSASEPDRDLDSIPDVLDDDADGDGLSDADEAMYGTDPTNPDTDGNGCYDYVDVLIGACDIDSDRLLSANGPECRPRFAQSRLVLHVRADFTDPLDDVTIVTRLDREFAGQNSVVTVTPLDATPADAAVIDQGKISAIRPGALLGIVVQVGPPMPNLVINVEVVSASAGVLARGSGIVVSEACKPYIG